MADAVDAVIIGAGVIGAAVALELNRIGVRTVSVDRIPPLATARPVGRARSSGRVEGLGRAPAENRGRGGSIYDGADVDSPTGPF